MLQEKDIAQIVKVISLLKENSDGEKFTSFFSYKKEDGVYTVDFFNYEQTLTRISIKEDSIEDALESLKGKIEQSVSDLGIEKNSGYTDREKKILGRILDKVRKLDSCDKVENLTFSFGTEKEESAFRISWDYCKDECTRYCCINGDTPQGVFEELETAYKTFPIEKKKDLLTFEDAKDSVSEFIADRERQKKRWTKARIVLLGGQGNNRNKSYSLDYSIGEFERLLNFKENSLTVQLEGEEKIFLNLSSVKWINKEDDTFYFYY